MTSVTEHSGGRARGTAAVVAEDLRLSYGTHAALDGLSLTVGAGEIVGLLGPNGAGKTTAVNVLSTLEPPDSGTASVAGHDVRRAPAAVRAVIALTGQYASVDEELTGRENLVLFARLLGLRKAAARARAAELLTAFDLLDAADRRAATYSGGMRRRLDLAAGLVRDPAVVFLDEPTTGLDPRSRLALWAAVRELRARGVAVLLTTQYLEEADRLADRIVVIDRGRVIATGTPQQLKEQVGGTFCEVTPADPADTPRVLTVLADLGADAHDDAVALPAPDGPATLTTVVRRMEDAGIAMTDIALRRPSLDEVFLALTGHPAAARADDDLSAEEPPAAVSADADTDTGVDVREAAG
ncbi:ATP-binding cassette domain-containing protein [Streptomyces sp. CBMA29]|uniref:ATP-binding cassette domain-containing protein n=1 Tax=Streptomyces sp. CBMA29 TaxID=1896314 RepID=UPI001661EF58|nr:ATP-binding cassette domain-containing protein [Streptomyces sp. CBMA29]MBD0735840.1 daunorubicin/doxorubicin resistance ABC transporter ATP-binding protein DrrA [Streptomyces sp. CBMA29]